MFKGMLLKRISTFNNERIYCINYQQSLSWTGPFRKLSYRCWFGFPVLTRAYDNNGGCPRQKLVFGILQLLFFYCYLYDICDTFNGCFKDNLLPLLYTHVFIWRFECLEKVFKGMLLNVHVCRPNILHQLAEQWAVNW